MRFEFNGSEGNLSWSLNTWHLPDQLPAFPCPHCGKPIRLQPLHHQCGLAAGGEGVGDEGQANDMRRQLYFIQ